MGRRKNFFSVKDVEGLQFDNAPFSSRFSDLLGERELGGMWIIYGKSGMGKTRFALELAKEFDRMGEKVLFLSLEMGLSSILRQEIAAAGIRGGINRIAFKESMSPEELMTLLKKQRSATMVFIDSVQYWQQEYDVTFETLLALRRRYPKKTFVFLSHVEGKEVEGRLAYQIKRDAMVRLQVEGFKTILKGRGKGGETGEYIIWPEGAAKYWLKD